MLATLLNLLGLVNEMFLLPQTTTIYALLACYMLFFRLKLWPTSSDHVAGFHGSPEMFLIGRKRHSPEGLIGRVRTFHSKDAFSWTKGYSHFQVLQVVFYDTVCLFVYIFVFLLCSIFLCGPSWWFCTKWQGQNRNQQGSICLQNLTVFVNLAKFLHFQFWSKVGIF